MLNSYFLPIIEQIILRQSIQSIILGFPSKNITIMKNKAIIKIQTEKIINNSPKDDNPEELSFLKITIFSYWNVKLTNG